MSIVCVKKQTQNRGGCLQTSEMENMDKIEIDSGTSPFPKPAVLVGSMIDGKPNFMNLAWLTRISFKPHLWVMSIGANKYTTNGIRESGKFSINIPSADHVVELDYCGITSGTKVDKSKLFDIFYGELEDVPMIRECPVCFELTVHQIIDIAERALIIGEVQHVYTEDRYMTDGKLDQEKIRQLVYTAPPSCYWTLGEKIADAFSVGKQLEH